MVTLTEAVLGQYRSFSLYNSPYPMHATGCAIDLYPEESRAVSPVSGRIVATRSVTAPVSPNGAACDFVIVLESSEYLVRILHVDPDVAVGEQIELGDRLGTLIESGFFAPWVDPHLHVGFRSPGSDPFRARGSLPITVDLTIASVPWDGTGVVCDRGDTYMILDSPGHPRPKRGFAGIGDGRSVIDGGFPHYSSGGVVGGTCETVSVAGERIGRVQGRQVEWEDARVSVDAQQITGISFAIHRDRLGVKLVSWEGILGEIGDGVTVTISSNRADESRVTRP